MPYSNEERNELDFYKSLVSELRDKHIQGIKEYIPKKFRDENGVLQSFEDIISTEGLENALLEGPLYSTVLFNPNLEGMDADEAAEVMSYYDGVRNSMLTIQDKNLKKYTKSELLNNTINRNFSELNPPIIISDPIPKLTDDILEQMYTRTLDPDVEDTDAEKEVAISLLKGTFDYDYLVKFGLQNGDVVTLDGNLQFQNMWLIEDNQKRRFINREDFFSSRYSTSRIRIVPAEYLKPVVTGKIIVLESAAPSVRQHYDTDPSSYINEPYSPASGYPYGGET